MTNTVDQFIVRERDTGLYLTGHIRLDSERSIARVFNSQAEAEIYLDEWFGDVELFHIEAKEISV